MEDEVPAAPFFHMSLEVARLAAKEGRHRDMVSAMKLVVDSDNHVNHLRGITDGDWNILLGGFTGLISSDRNFRKVLLKVEKKMMGDADNATVIRSYIQRLERILDGVCCEVIDLISTTLFGDEMKNAHKYEFRPKIYVSLFRMLGDAFRYRAELLQPGEIRKELVGNALREYEYGYTLAQHEELNVSDPIYMGIVLNMCVCKYAMSDDRESGLKLLEKAEHESRDVRSSSYTELGFTEEERIEANRIHKMMNNNLYKDAVREFRIKNELYVREEEWEDLNSQ